MASGRRSGRRESGEEMQQRLWPTEEFELARSRVPVSLPETDLFDGVQP